MTPVLLGAGVMMVGVLFGVALVALVIHLTTTDVAPKRLSDWRRDG